MYSVCYTILELDKNNSNNVAIAIVRSFIRDSCLPFKINRYTQKLSESYSEGKKYKETTETITCNYWMYRNSQDRLHSKVLQCASNNQTALSAHHIKISTTSKTQTILGPQNSNHTGYNMVQQIENKVSIADIAMPLDHNTTKINKYFDLIAEKKQMWKVSRVCIYRSSLLQALSLIRIKIYFFLILLLLFLFVFSIIKMFNRVITNNVNYAKQQYQQNNRKRLNITTLKTTLNIKET